MTRPALTIALLLRSPELESACCQWLPSNRYTPLDLGLEDSEVDLVTALAQQREAVDAVVIEQSLLQAETREALLGRGLLFPAVVVGELMGHVDYHPEEVHLPGDQLEQLGYNVDAAISRFLRHGQKDFRPDPDVGSVDSEQGGGSPLEVPGNYRTACRRGLVIWGFFTNETPHGFWLIFLQMNNGS